MATGLDPDSAFDQGIGVEIVRHGLGAIADEMAISHVRAAYSSVVRDMLDFSTAVCDRQGRVIAQGLSLALQLGAIPRLMAQLLPRVDRFEPGDVYVVNHPWQGGVHLPDFFFVRPVYLEGSELPAAFTVIVSHMLDVGGPIPGGVSVSARDLWDEGLVLPPVALVSRGIPNKAVFDIIAANSRDPKTVLGDIRAVEAGLETGARQFADLARRTGSKALLHAIDQLLDSTERATRAAIAVLPDGEATASDYLDHGVGDFERAIVCHVVKQGERLSFDFTGTTEQLRAGINCNASDLMSVVAFATRCSLGQDIPVNDGFYRCLNFTAPEGTLVNAQYPAAVGARGSTMYLMCDVALAAVGELLGGRIAATSGGPGVVYMSGVRDSKPWYFMDFISPGWGGRAQSDGVVGASPPINNAANIPVEVIEQATPVRLRQFSLATDSGAAGAFRGAPAIVREYEFLADSTAVNLRLDRYRHVAQGLGFGLPGGRSFCRIRRKGGDWEEGRATANYVFNTGDIMHIQLASGGGFGDPKQREPEAIARDIADGLVSELGARDLYNHRTPKRRAGLARR